MVTIAAGIAAAGAVAGGAIGAAGSKRAASTQADAQREAARLQYQMYQETAARLAPWVASGREASGQLGGLLGLPGYTVGGPLRQAGWGIGDLVRPFEPTMAQLEQTPGYQFTKEQGQEAVTNAAAAMGLGVSGPLLKGIGKFTTGLASQTFQQQFQNYWAQLGQVYNMLSGVSTTGENAAAMTGQAGGAAAASAGNFLSGAGASQAAGELGAAGAYRNALSGLSGIGQYAALTGQFNGSIPVGSSSAPMTDVVSGSPVGYGMQTPFGSFGLPSG